MNLSKLFSVALQAEHSCEVWRHEPEGPISFLPFSTSQLRKSLQLDYISYEVKLPNINQYYIPKRQSEGVYA